MRELVTGDSLFNLVKKGWRVNEDEVKKIAIQVLEILNYLHQQTPPIIHRDIKPHNLIKSKEGKLFLVDFGSVQEVYRQTLSGGTIFVGTLGYMPPEQLRGQTSFASDLYSLGATLVFLLTKQNPDNLPQPRMKIDFRSQVKISDKLANWLDKTLEPIAEERFQSVEEALEALYSHNKFPQPAKSRIILDRTNSSLKIKIPHSGIQGERWSKQNIQSIAFFLFSTAFLWFGLYLTSLAIMDNKPWIMAVPIPLLSIPGWIITILTWKPYIFANFGKTYLEIDQQNFKVTKCLLGLVKITRGETKNIHKVEDESSNDEIDGYNIVHCTIEGNKKSNFGTGIRREEQQWLLAEIRDFLAKCRE